MHPIKSISIQLMYLDSIFNAVFVLQASGVGWLELLGIGRDEEEEDNKGILEEMAGLIELLLFLLESGTKLVVIIC